MMKKNDGRVRISMSLYLDKAVDREIHDNLKALSEQFGGNLSETLREICRAYFGIGFPPHHSVPPTPRVSKDPVPDQKPQKDELLRSIPSYEESPKHEPQNQDPVGSEPNEPVKKPKVKPKGLWKA